MCFDFAHRFARFAFHGRLNCFEPAVSHASRRAKPVKKFDSTDEEEEGKLSQKDGTAVRSTAELRDYR
jgi:hypothetical protein